jgi:hypothetical protein
MPKSNVNGTNSPSKPKSVKAKPLPGWKDITVSRLRHLIEEADPEAVEEQKWKRPSNPAGVPVWYHDGIVCHVVALKNRVRLTILKGAHLKDTKGLFNACLEGNSMRAIDIGEEDEIDAEAIKSLVRAAVALNSSSTRGRH